MMMSGSYINTFAATATMAPHSHSDFFARHRIYLKNSLGLGLWEGLILVQRKFLKRVTLLTTNPLTLGTEINKAYPQYCVWHRNCQDWTRDLVEVITGESKCPQTLSEMKFIKEVGAFIHRP